MFDITLATCTALPNLDVDNALLLLALEARGLRAQPVVWNDPGVDWSATRATIIRSTWDYHHQRDAFLAWAGRVARVHDLWNPLALLTWNTHKFYLRDLEQQGVPIVPTLWLKQGTPTDLAALMARQGWPEVVIKPAISASSYATILVTEENVQSGQEHLHRFLASTDMLLQPFLKTVTSSRERSLIFIDGVCTHAVERVPTLGLALDEQDRLIPPQADELRLAQIILNLLPVAPLYARVDLIHDGDRMLRLMELELVEPGLWLALAPHAVQLFAEAIARKVTAETP